MLKLGAHCNVQRFVRGKKRSAAEVAKELEDRMLDRGMKILTSSVAQPATQSDGNPAEALAPKLAKTEASPEKSASLHRASHPCAQTAPSSASAGSARGFTHAGAIVTLLEPDACKPVGPKSRRPAFRQRRPRSPVDVHPVVDFVTQRAYNVRSFSSAHATDVFDVWWNRYSTRRSRYFSWSTFLVVAITSSIASILISCVHYTRVISKPAVRHR